MKKLFFTALVAVVAVGGALTAKAQYNGYLADGTPRNCTLTIGNSCDGIQLYDSPTDPKNAINQSVYEDYFYPVAP
ncbi:hypothetical protein [Pedobacter hiemivivus]|uniref:Uncharacterized protein n=1 Tax=Pedobacter hiemivivus TaxID=2530454 RepID=A0A4R0NJT1_9SPHI|nr:hypothetical protein [Pedobacter hiemivivus]TCC99563.1 hypothetical protein EZ444_02490 [Pedobacter hiemivivus]